MESGVEWVAVVLHILGWVICGMIWVRRINLSEARRNAERVIMLRREQHLQPFAKITSIMSVVTAQRNLKSLQKRVTVNFYSIRLSLLFEDPRPLD